MDKNYPTTIILSISVIFLSIIKANQLTTKQSLTPTIKYSPKSWLAVCGDGVKMSAEECDDNNTRNGDGCSDLCLIQDQFTCAASDSVNISVCFECLGATYQASNKSVCLACHQHCATCNSDLNCLSCLENSNRYLDTITNRCLPLDGYFDDGINLNAIPCDPSCLTCNALGNSSCLSCSNNKIIVFNVCELCSDLAGPLCTSCSSSGSKIKCDSCVNSIFIDGSCVESISQARILVENLSQPSKQGLWMVLLPSFYGGFLLLKSCLILFCIWRRSKHRKNKVQQKQNERQKQSFQNIDNKYIQPEKIQNLSDSNIASDSAEDSRYKNLRQNRKQSNKRKIKTSKKPNALVVNQKEIIDDGYQVLQNVRELNIPSKNKKNQKFIKSKQILTGQSYRTAQTKRKVLGKRRNNEQNYESEISEQERMKNIKIKQQNLVFQQQDQT